MGGWVGGWVGGWMYEMVGGLTWWLKAPAMMYPAEHSAVKRRMTTPLLTIHTTINLALFILPPRNVRIELRRVRAAATMNM